jgi:DNA-directed RNA polymerase specialized sigma24 family protein
MTTGFGLGMLARTSPPTLDAAAFAQLLARLHDDPQQAGDVYEDLRRMLLRFFEWRGVITADAAADEAIDRLSRRLSAGETVVDVRAYVLGIARMVALEHQRRPETRHVPLDPPSEQHLAAPADRPGDETRMTCFDGCIGALAPDVREFIVGYYSATGRARIDTRAELARRHRLTPNALRLRAQRVRDHLEDCIGRCLAAAPTQGGWRAT